MFGVMRSIMFVEECTFVEEVDDSPLLLRRPGSRSLFFPINMGTPALSRVCQSKRPKFPNIELLFLGGGDSARKATVDLDKVCGMGNEFGFS